MQEGKFVIDDCGIFIGLSSMPLPFTKGKAFYEKKIREGIFNRYRRTVLEYAFSKAQDDPEYLENFERYFYQTRAYYLFGAYELAVLALVDDFKLGNKTFHPYSYLSEGLVSDEERDGLEPETFTFHTMTGISAVGNTTDAPYQNPSLISRALDTFLRPSKERSHYPFIGICALKINNALLVGQRNMVEYLIAKQVEYLLATAAGAGANFDFILLRTTAWNEFTLLLFADSYERMTELILSIRELQFKDIETSGEEDKAVMETIRTNCLLHRMISDWQAGDEHLVDEAHLFVHTHTTFGFDLALFPHLSEENEPYPAHFLPIQDEQFQLNVRFDVKPGHLRTLLDKLTRDSASTKIRIGTGDFLYPSQQGDISMVYKDLLRQERVNQLSKHIRKIHATPNFNLDPDKIKGSKLDDHFFYSHRLGNFAFSLHQIKTIREQLILCRVAKPIREKVINMFVNYNHQIQDPILFNYFIELRPLLEYVAACLSDFLKGYSLSVEAISAQLLDLANSFEKAFNNRSSLSFQGQGNGLNFDFNGGAQQLISLFDSVAKLLSAAIHLPFEKGPTLIITSVSEIHFSGSTLEVGLNHLIQPSLFLSMATHVITSDFLNKTTALEGKYQEFHQQTIRLLGQQEQIPFLDSEGELDAILGALINYYVTYNKDSELFLFWYWHQFLQQPSAYHQHGEIEENMFIRYLIRLMILIEFLDPEAVFFRAKIIAPFPELQNLWFRWFIHIRKRVNGLLENSPIQILKNWFDQAKDLVTTEIIPRLYAGVLEKGLQTETELLNVYRTMLEENGRTIESGSVDDLRRQMTKDWQVELEAMAKVILVQLEEGKPFIPPTEKRRSTNFYVQATTLAYLRLIRKAFTTEHTILYRLPANGNPSAFFDPIDDKFQRQYGPFVFDPKGGLFTTSITARRQYFRYRIALYVSLTAIIAEQKLKLYWQQKKKGIEKEE